MSEARDPRLDAPGDDHPGVRPSNFDLIALEQTRYGLRGIGLALFALSIGAPFVLRHHETTLFAVLGWCAWAIGAGSMLAALTITAPTPHGPLPKFVRNSYWILCAISFAMSLAHFVVVAGAFQAPGAIAAIRSIVNLLLLPVSFVLLPAILWRFCQHRGLTGRAIVWLWIAMGMCAAGVLSNSLHGSAWAIPVLGLIALIAAQQTARDVWLDAVYRHSKFFVVTNPRADVAPLRPADKH